MTYNVSELAVEDNRGVIMGVLEELSPGVAYILTVTALTVNSEVGNMSTPVTVLTESSK